MATLHPYLGISLQQNYTKERNKKYERKNVRRFALHLNKNTDKKIIQWLENNKPYQTTIKRLIREEMIREKKKK